MKNTNSREYTKRLSNKMISKFVTKLEKVKHQLWPLDRKIRVIEQVAKESRELGIANKTLIQGKVVL